VFVCAAAIVRRRHRLAELTLRGCVPPHGQPNPSRFPSRLFFCNAVTPAENQDPDFFPLQLLAKESLLMFDNAVYGALSVFFLSLPLPEWRRLRAPQRSLSSCSVLVTAQA
jgi:hypothetical protein